MAKATNALSGYPTKAEVSKLPLRATGCSSYNWFGKLIIFYGYFLLISAGSPKKI